MRTRNAKRKRSDLEELCCDGGTSGSSLKLANAGEDTDSSINHLDFVNGAGRNGGNRVAKGTSEDLEATTSTRRMKKAKTGLDKGEIELEKKDLKKLGCAPGSLSLERSRANEDTFVQGHDFIEERLTKEEKKLEAVQLMKNGATNKFLAERYGVKSYTITNWRHKYASETLIDRNQAHSDETILAVCQELRKNVTKASITSKMGIEKSTLLRWERKYLLAKLQETTPEGSWEYDRYTKLAARSRLKKGESLDIIAKELDIPIHVLRKWESEKTVTIFSTPESGHIYDKEFILNACKLLQQGESVYNVSKKLGISVYSVYDWRDKYCSDKLPEPSGGHKYSKDTILRACELLKCGEKAIDVARKLKLRYKTVNMWKLKYLKKAEKECRNFNTLSTVLYLARNCRCKRLVLEAYRLWKQGDSSWSIAKKIGKSHTLVLEWKRKYFIKRMVTEDDLKMSQQLRKSFTIGDCTTSISIKFGIDDSTIDKLRLKYQEEISSKFLEKMSTAGKLIDSKLKIHPIVALQIDQKVDKLCQMQNVHPYARIGKFIDKNSFRQALNRLKDGASTKIIAKELGLGEHPVEVCKMKYIAREKRVRKKSTKGKYCEVLPKAVDLMKKGATTKFLVQRYGVRESIISGWRRRYAVETLRRRSFRDKDTVLEACKELKKGGTVISVAGKMGLPLKKIRSWQAEYLTRRLRETTSEGSYEYDRYTKLEAWEQIDQGFATEAIARDLCVSISLVRKWKIDGAGTKRQKKSKFKPDCSLLNKRKSKKRKLAKIFIPLRKVYIPIKMKLTFVKMIDEGVPINKLSKDLNVNELTLKSWVLNRDLLLKRSNAAQERNNN